MKYCIFCGNETDTKGAQSTCNTCGKITFDNPKATTGLLMYTPDKKHFVFAVRAGEPHKGKLDTFGGFLENGETLEAGTYREVLEECGVTKDGLGEFIYLGSSANEYEWGGYTTHTSAVWFMAELKHTEKLQPIDDVAAIKMIPVGELPPEEDFAWRGMRELFEKGAQLLASM